MTFESRRITSAPELRRRKLRRLAKAGLVLLAIGGMTTAIGIAWRTYRIQKEIFYPARRSPGLTIAALGVPGASAVMFRSGALTLRGWYAPSTNRAAVILLHGAGGDRASLRAEARILARAGYGLLSFDGPGHGESSGEIQWSEAERVSVRAALDFLEQQSGIAPGGIGAFGFSLGGYVLAQVAAVEPRIRAAVFASTPSDPVAQARWQHRHFWLLSQLPALLVLQRGGMDLDVRARDLVAGIAPRPVLFVTGTADTTVPHTMAHELYAAAREPKELYVISGAGHGDYAAIASSAYASRLVAFFDRSLRPGS